jgi:hypothetical protein
LEQWKRDFWQSAAGKAVLRQHKGILLEIAADGTFTAENVQPGFYKLYAHLYDRAVDNARSGSWDNATMIGQIPGKKITISETTGEAPVDLGTIQFRSTGAQARSH